MRDHSLEWTLACLACFGVGCTSAPVHYYTLTPPPDKSWPTADEMLAIDVRVIHTPPQLDRAELLVRAGPSNVTLLENEYWLSPLHDEIKDALRLELQRRLGRLRAVRPSLTKITIDIDVQHFEAQLGQHALFQASWRATLFLSDQRPNGERLQTCAFLADERISTDYAGMVEGYQREIAEFAEEIVSALTRSESDIDSVCRKSIDTFAGASDVKDH
jgi:uncharacterized protein